MEELFQRIQDSYSELSPTRQMIAQYFINNYNEIPFQSITVIAKNLGVSETSIIKYCSQLGFSGFSDFKSKALEYVQMKALWQEKTAVNISAGRGKDIITNVVKEEFANIQKTIQDEQNQKSLLVLLDALDRAENIYIVGIRSSAILARYLYLSLGQQGYRTIALTPRSCDCRLEAIRMDKKDLLISFAFSNYHRDTVDIVEYAVKKGIEHISITDTLLSPTARFAKTSLICTINSFHNTPSLVAPIALCDLILAACAQKHAETVIGYMKQVEEFYQGRDLYEGLSKGKE